MPPSRNLGVGNASCGERHAVADPLSLIVAAGARKEKLRQRDFPRPLKLAPPAPRPYVEMRAASAFSFLDGASLPEDLVEEAARLEIPAVALVDRNGVYGAPRFWKAAKAAGVRALVGAEVTLGEEAGSRRQAAGEGPRLTLLVENRTGYRNLCRLITAGALGKPKGETAVTLEQVAAHAEGLHVATGGDESPVARSLAGGGPDAARALLERLGAIFPGRLHVELQRHRLREEERRNQALVDLARRLRLPLFASNGVRYARKKDKELHDVFTCIRHHTTLDRAGRLLAAQRERHFRGAAEMAGLFSDLPETLDAAVELSRRLDFTLADLGYRFPDYPLPPGETPSSYLRQVAWNGARARFRPLTAKAQAQIEKELAMIEKLDLAGYFLIVWDIVRFCMENRILAQGRGSAANSAVCYALSITAVDPVKMELLFERFLSEERGEWPDIDLDLPVGGPAREGHPARLREVRPARRRHDGQRHHLPRPLLGARDRQGPRLLAGAGRRALQAARRLELRRDPRSAGRARPGGPRGGSRSGGAARAALPAPLSPDPEPPAPPRPALGRDRRRGREGSTRSCRSSRPRCRGASSCSGTRTTARTSGS